MCQKKIMRKRSSEHLTPEEPPKKRISPGGNLLPVQIPPGEILTDLSGKQWKLGKAIGQGGFGEIYLASDNLKDPVRPNAMYVVKIEDHTNGPLFVEINCLLRTAKEDMINEWKQQNNCSSLGMPHYVASGSHLINNEKLRFLVLPRYEQDLEKLLLARDKKFNVKTVTLICKQILDVLKYIHSKGYVHCDIKASNILNSLPAKKIIKHCNPKRDCNPKRLCREKKMRSYYPEYNGRHLRLRQRVNYDEDVEEIKDECCTTEEIDNKTNQIILIDYGLATKFRHPNGRHKQYCNDERKAHAGTILFCSIDAHLGASSRRSDLETLGYNLIYWLTSNLPWVDNVANPETVQQQKEFSLNNLDNFLKSCFPMHDYPLFVYEYFTYVKSLTFEAEPDYEYCKKLFQTALEEYGYKNDGFFDFDNSEGWGKIPKRALKKTHIAKPKSKPKPRVSTNKLEKPILRKNAVTMKKKLYWARIVDPEVILRQYNKNVEVSKSRERKLTDSSDSSCGIQNLDIYRLNPTYAMLEVFNKSKDKNANYNSYITHKGEIAELNHRKGNTPAMDLVLLKMKLKQLEEDSETENNYMKVTKKVKNNDKKKAKIANSPAKELTRRRHLSLRNRGYGLRG